MECNHPYGDNPSCTIICTQCGYEFPMGYEHKPIYIKYPNFAQVFWINRTTRFGEQIKFIE